MSTSSDPLWVLIAMAFDSAPNAREGAAAVLRVIADEVVPEEDFHDFSHGSIAEIMWRQRRLTRKRLLAEAERVEAGR